jgi:hypothetical protein
MDHSPERNRTLQKKSSKVHQKAARRVARYMSIKVRAAAWKLTDKIMIINFLECDAGCRMCWGHGARPYSTCMESGMYALYGDEPQINRSPCKLSTARDCRAIILIDNEFDLSFEQLREVMLLKSVENALRIVNCSRTRISNVNRVFKMVNLDAKSQVFRVFCYVVIVESSNRPCINHHQLTSVHDGHCTRLYIEPILTL